MQNGNSFGTPIRLATRHELLREFTDRQDVPAFALYADSECALGEISHVIRHSFQDAGELCRLLRSAIARLEAPCSAEGE